MSPTPPIWKLIRFRKIVYTSIVGVVLVMACLEWFLWLAAFVYCLVKVFQKAEHWSINVLCVVVGVAFVLLRYVDGFSFTSKDTD